MKPLRVLMIGAALLLLLVLVQGMQAAETYGYVTKWGSHGMADGQLNNPRGVAVDTYGTVYVADTGNNRIQTFDTNGNYVSQTGSQGTGDGQFSDPHGVAVDTSGNVYVADTGNQRIQKFDSRGTYLMQWGFGSTGDGKLFLPWGIAVDTSGNIFVVDMSRSLYKFDSNGNFMIQWERFRIPTGAAVDTSGNVYVVEMYSNLQKFDAGGTCVMQWGPDYGTGNFSTPLGVAVDTAGNVYVADTGNNRIQKYDSEGEYITQWGFQGFSGNGSFDGPIGVAADTSGNIYVADSGNNRIQKFAKTLPGSIYVTSDPSGAAIRLDGIDTGQVTPFGFNSINPSDHSVDVRLAGYFPASKMVTVTADATTTADFPLRIPQTGSLAVSSTPAGAEIWINGQDTGQVTPFIFEKGYGTFKIEVKIHDQCYQAPAQIVIISPEALLATADLHLSQRCAIPEFPSPVMPAVMLAGCAGMMLLITRMKE
jgi:sugar lactone lactonase YvrE